MKGIIYQIFIESHPNIHYIGSTTRSLRCRWKEHKSRFKQDTDVSIYPYFEQLGIENFQIRVLKEYDVIDKQHLKAYEQLWISKLHPVNIQKNLIRTEHMARCYKKTYYEKNFDVLREKQRTYRESKKESIKDYHRIYQENNRESIREQRRTYRENNKELIREQQKKKFICPCNQNKEISFYQKARHEQSIKHQKYLQSLEESKSQ
jgi:hypothetical protein